MISKLAISLFIVTLSSTVSAATYECRAEWAAYLSEDFADGLKVASKEYTNRLQLMVRITDEDKIKLERCSFVKSVNKQTCDTHYIDKEIEDKNVGMRKLYITSSQYDIQLIKLGNGMIGYIENNGRGGIATGFCNVINK